MSPRLTQRPRGRIRRLACVAVVCALLQGSERPGAEPARLSELIEQTVRVVAIFGIATGLYLRGGGEVEVPVLPFEP